MATAKKLPSGSWRCRPYLGKDANGKSIYGSCTAPKQKLAEQKAALMEMRHDKRISDGITVGEAVDRYIRAKESILSPKTIREYKAMRRRALGDIMSRGIQTLTTEKLQIAVNLYATDHSPKSVRNAVGLITAALAMFAPDLRLRASVPRGNKPKLSIPSESQIKALIGDADEPLKTAILLAAVLGLRRSEICALTWEDIDAKKKTLTINKAIVISENGVWKNKGTKTESGTRLLDIPDFLLIHLRELPQVDERIIQVSPDSITYRFITLRNKHNLTIRFHDLRHYFASLLLALGVPDKYSMQRMGHATPNMLKSVYQHIMQDKQDEVTASINTALEQRFNS